MSQEILSLGIVGGTFDPIHYGHLNPVKEAAGIIGLERVHFVPASNPPHRPKPLADSHHRLAMVKLALKDYPEFIPDDRELQRAGNSYTLNTLESFREEFGNEIPIMMFIGADAFSEFNTWHQWQQIPNLANIIVLTRPGYPFTELDVLHGSSDILPGWQKCQDIDQLFSKPHGQVFFQNVTPVSISATKIRTLLDGERQDDKYLLQALPPTVYDYINSNNLYTSRTLETKCNHRN